MKCTFGGYQALSLQKVSMSVEQVIDLAFSLRDIRSSHVEGLFVSIGALDPTTAMG